MTGLAAATTGLDKDRAPLEERFGPSRSPPSAEVYPSSSSSSSSRRTAVRRGRSRGRDRWRDLEIAGDLSFTSPRVEVYGLHDDEQHPSEHETEHAIWSEEEHGPPVEEPLSMAHIDPRNIQRCSRWDAGDITGGGATCGPPLSAPCFDRSRCRQLSVYVYDQEVCPYRVDERNVTCVTCASTEHTAASRWAPASRIYVQSNAPRPTYVAREKGRERSADFVLPHYSLLSRRVYAASFPIHMYTTQPRQGLHLV